MKTSKTALFNTIDDIGIEVYSRHKLGDVEVTASIADKLATLISSKLRIKECSFALYTTNKYPLNSFCKKNSLLLSEIISSKLSLPLFVGEYSYKYNLSNFYDDYAQRHNNIHLPFLSNKDDIKQKGYKFIMVDDSTVTGISFRASMPELGQVTDSVDFFVLVDLEGKVGEEKLANEFSFNHGGVPLLVSIINQSHYVFTSHMVRTVEKLPKEDKEQLLGAISDSRRDLFVKARTVYFDEIAPK